MPGRAVSWPDANARAAKTTSTGPAGLTDKPGRGGRLVAAVSRILSAAQQGRGPFAQFLHQGVRAAAAGEDGAELVASRR